MGSGLKAPEGGQLERLVQRYLDTGDESNWDRLVESTRPRLLALARRIAGAGDARRAARRRA